MRLHEPLTVEGGVDAICELFLAATAHETGYQPAFRDHVDHRQLFGKLDGIFRQRQGIAQDKAGLGAPLILPSFLYSAQQKNENLPPFTALPGQRAFTPDELSLLQEIISADFLYFWEQANPETGVVKDRCNVITQEKTPLGSIAALGFGLTAICIGEMRGLVSYNEARGRVLTSLRFIWKKLPNHRGFFYHWANVDTGERLWDSEISSVDTAILLCGILTCRQHFEHSEISELARFDFRPRGLDMALRRHADSSAWMVA